MAVLVFLLLSLWTSQVQAAPEKDFPVEVILDSGNPDASVGVVGENLLEVGSLYENYSVVGFDASSIVLKESESADLVKWFQRGKIPKVIHARARRLFIVKQMRAIFEAQIKYLEKFQDHFASDLNALIDQGFLANGFEDMQKQNYTFRVLEAGHAKLLAVQFKREPTFIAIAEPLDPQRDPWFFSVDQLGQVRYSQSLRGVTWGPVWEYNGLNEEPPRTVITHSQNDEEKEEN